MAIPRQRLSDSEGTTGGGQAKLGYKTYLCFDA